MAFNNVISAAMRSNNAGDFLINVGAALAGTIDNNPVAQIQSLAHQVCAR